MYMCVFLLALSDTSLSLSLSLSLVLSRSLSLLSHCLSLNLLLSISHGISTCHACTRFLSLTLTPFLSFSLAPFVSLALSLCFPLLSLYIYVHSKAEELARSPTCPASTLGNSLSGFALGNFARSGCEAPQSRRAAWGGSAREGRMAPTASSCKLL